jgi:HlyD family secretion protein
MAVSAGEPDPGRTAGPLGAEALSGEGAAKSRRDQLSSDLASLRIARGEPPRRRLRGRRLAAGLATVTLIAAAAVWGPQKLVARIYKQPVRVTEVAMISPVQSLVLVAATGYVVPQSWCRVDARVPGRLLRVHVKEGDRVEAGAPIAELEDRAQRSAIAAAQSRVLVARARVETARGDLAEVGVRVERTRALVRHGAATAADLQDLEARQQVLASAVKAAEAQVRAAEAETQTLRVALQDLIITAPLAGTVIGKPAMPGEIVGGQGQGAGVVAEIADFRSIVVETDVPEARLGMVRVGGPAEIVLDAYPDRRYRGEVLKVGTRVNRAKGTAVVQVRFKDDQTGVLPDMSARISLLREEIDAETLNERSKKVVAADAITERDGSNVLFVVEEGKLRIVKVRIGGAVGGSVELLDGPPPGTRVVRAAGPDSFDGQRIKDAE